METEEYYNRLFKEMRDTIWNDAPGKKVLLSVFVKMIKEKENRIVDIGCGNGYFINEIRVHNPVRNHAQHYYAFDISEEAVHRAKREYKGIQFTSSSQMLQVI